MSIIRALASRLCPVQVSTVDQENQQDKCSICLLEMIDRTETACHHFFHEGCLKFWLASQKTCPLCRFVLIKEQPHRPVCVADPIYDLDLSVRYGGPYRDYYTTQPCEITVGEVCYS